MRDYGQIVTKLTSIPWLITPEGLDMILDIAHARLNGNPVTEEQLNAAMAARQEREYRTWDAQVHRGVGILPIAGPIFGKANMMTQMSGATSLEDFRQDFRKMMNDSEVHSVVLEMDTPGGTADLVQETADEIHSSRGVKSTYAISNTSCGSAGLFLATQATKMYSTPSGQTGSLGVYRVHRDQSQKDAKDGYHFSYVQAGKYKTEGNPHEALSSEGREFHQEGVNELYGDFVNTVARGRNVSATDVESLYGQGRMLSARKAREVGMIDGILQMESLVTQLANQHEAANADGGSRTFSLYFSSEDAEAVKMSLPQSREKGENMDRNKLLQLAQQLGIEGITDAVSDEELEAKIFSAVSTQTSELAELRPLNALKDGIDGAKKFSEQFPDEWAKMQKLETTNRINAAAAFTGRISNFTKLEGDKPVPDKSRGFSAIALEQIDTLHQAFSTHSATVEQFEQFVTSITSGSAIVDFSEAGSGRTKEGEDPVVLDGIDARMQFSGLVNQIAAKEENKEKSYMEIVKLAASENPELYERYRSPVMAGRN